MNFKLQQKKAKYSFLEAKSKLEAFCAYQERCVQEIENKLRDWGINGEQVDFIVADLISNNFLNEERFASAFVSGKMRIKKWGRIKIKQHLKQKNISSYSLNKALKEIDEEEYLNNLNSLTEKKIRLTKAKSKWDKRMKVQRYLLSKGYETNLVLESLKEHFKN